MQDDKEKNTWSGTTNGSDRLHRYNQNKLNTIIGKSIKAVLKSLCKDCTQREEHNTINEFDALSLSSSNDNDVSCI
eukprot:12830910-Ditylum_brightwellii.AAC.1